MTPMPWWKRLPARLLEEEQALLLLRQGEVALVRTHRWLRAPDGEPRVNVQLALGSRNIELEVRFPAHYPEGCPSVRPIPYDKPVSSHQFVHSGVFCLELGPDNWHPRYTAADMVASAWRLLAQEFIRTFEPIEIPSRHVSDLAERVRVGKGVLLRSPEFDKCLESAQGNTQFDFVWPTRNLFRIFPVGFPKGVALTDVPVALDNETRSTGLLIRLSEGAPDAAPTEPKEFREFILEHGKVEVEEGVLLVILRWHSGKTRGFCCFPKSTFELVDMPLDLSMGPRAAEPLREALSTLKVGIVGLGSLGSKVAVSLARTGVRRFVLVDGDILEGPNVCRHAADFSDLGAAKVDAVRELIRCVSVGEPEIKRHCVNLATATNPDLHAAVLEDLGTVDILIDATANPDVFGVLAMVASDKRRPMVWGEVFGGGLGGLVAFAHPERGGVPALRSGWLSGRGGLVAPRADYPTHDVVRRRRRRAVRCNRRGRRVRRGGAHEPRLRPCTWRLATPSRDAVRIATWLDFRDDAGSAGACSKRRLVLPSMLDHGVGAGCRDDRAR